MFGPAWITAAIIALNTAVFGVIMSRGGGWNPSVELLTRWGANYGPLTLNGDWWRLLTATILHANAVHLLCNMYALWYAGRIAEPLFGRGSFLLLYLLASVGGSVASLWWHPFVTGVGASGAIFGVYGGLVAWLTIRHRSMPAGAGGSLAGGVISIVAYNLVFGMLQTHVDVAAHVGGLMTGMVAGAALAVPLPGTLVWASARGALVAIAAVAALGVAASRLPKVDDVRRILAHVSEVDEKTTAEFNGLLAALQQGQITREKFAEDVSTSVLPRLTAARGELAQMRAGSEAQRVGDLVKYMTVREEGIRLLTEGTKTGDASLLKAASQKQAEAEAFAATVASRVKAARRSSTPPESVSLSGTVKDGAVPRADARLSLTCPSPPGRAVPRTYLQACGTPREVRTDAQGHFGFSSLVPGPYIVRVALDGYAPDEKKIDLDDNTSLAFSLRPAVDLNSVFKGIEAVERDTVTRLNTALNGVRAGRVTPERFSHIVKDDLLPPWEKQRADLEKLKLTPEQQAATARVLTYLQLRGEAWTLLAEGVRTNNVALLKRAQQKNEAAMSQAKRMPGAAKSRGAASR